jgi:hypothetical protein
MKGQSEKSVGRILLDDNTGGVPVKLWPIRFQCVGFWISTGLPCIYTHMSSIPTCKTLHSWRIFRKSNYCVHRCVSVFVLRVRVRSRNPQDSRCSGRDTNCALSEHKTEALALHQPDRWQFVSGTDCTWELYYNSSVGITETSTDIRLHSYKTIGLCLASGDKIIALLQGK